MKISVLTVFKELYEPFISTSLLKRATQKGLLSFDIRSFFDFVDSKQRIDAPPFGHGTGMVIKPEVVQKGVEVLESAHGKAFKIFFSPQGKKVDQTVMQELARKAKEYDQMMLIPARYEGMDARVEQQYADAVLSMGDFVLMGGDIPAMMLIEGVTRLMPGVVSKQESIEEESFSGPFLDYPEYTQPVTWQGLTVPEIIRSGNHGAVDAWRQEQAVRKTVLSHFDWIQGSNLSAEQKKMVESDLPSHYLVLMHDQINLGTTGRVGTTSIMSIDIHDIARSCKTYGIKKFYLVSPLKDQQEMVARFLSFWHKEGPEYRADRHSAINLVAVKDSLDQVVADIQEQEDREPTLIATSAQSMPTTKQITFHDQSTVWQEKKPLLFVLGTGNGLATSLIEQCEYGLIPIEGIPDFNHLSVRSAAGIILDRWLGLNQKKLKDG